MASGTGGCTRMKRAACRAAAVEASSGRYVGQCLVELGHGLGHVGSAQRPRHHGGLGDVLVAACGVERFGSVAVVGSQEAVDLGDVHPAEQVRVGRLVRSPVGRDTRDPAVHRSDDPDRAVGVLDRAERGLGEERAGALQASPGVALEAGVLVDGRHRQRVQRLQEQRADAADEHRRVTVHGADGVVRAEPARALGVQDALAPLRPLVAGDAREDHRAHAPAHRLECAHRSIVP